MGIPLTNLKPGTSAEVLDIDNSGPLRQRLMDLGLIPGSVVKRVINSPIGDPVCYLIRGAMIALRSVDAATVRVTV